MADCVPDEHGDDREAEPAEERELPVPRAPAPGPAREICGAHSSLPRRRSGRQIRPPGARRIAERPALTSAKTLIRGLRREAGLEEARRGREREGRGVTRPIDREEPVRIRSGGRRNEQTRSPRWLGLC